MKLLAMTPIKIDLGKRRRNAECQQEEALVVELAQNGVRYLACGSSDRPISTHDTKELLVCLVRQSNSRVRNAIIALLLIHPEYSRQIPVVLELLQEEDRSILQILYTAACFLQQKYRSRLKAICERNWQELPDLYSTEFIQTWKSSPDDNLKLLGSEHQRLSGKIVNWAGTYDHVAQQLIHQLELEARWNQSHPNR